MVVPISALQGRIALVSVLCNIVAFSILRYHCECFASENVVVTSQSC